MHYCDIFGDCFHCPASFCPYEKLEPGMYDGGYETDEADDEEEEDICG